MLFLYSSLGSKRRYESSRRKGEKGMLGFPALFSFLLRLMLI
jgi:hypothetical protein